MDALRGNITLDTSALIEFLTGTELGRIVKEYFETLKPEEKAHGSLYAVSEIFYVLCRLEGPEYAAEKTGEIFGSQVVEIDNTEGMAFETGRLKCERAISIGDCSCIATARITGSRAVFAQSEKEIMKEMNRTPFPVEILFLSESDRIER